MEGRAAPDSLLPTAQLNAVSDGFFGTMENISGPPDLAVEILSPGGRWSEVEGKVADYLAAGARRVWLVDPRERRVIVRYADRPSRVLTDCDILDGEDVVPGFALPLAELFAPVA